MSCLKLYLLGPPRIERDDLPVSVDTRKAIALLAYVAITGESHRRDSLVNLLWPEYDQSRGRANLRRTLYALNKALAGDWLDVDRETLRLNPSADIWLDVDQFHRHLAECLRHGHPAAQVCPACLSPLTAAVELYRGDFLSGFSLKDSLNFDDWQFFQADALRRELADALERLVQGHIAQGAFERAISCARRWLALDRLDEAAHCQLMRLYAWCGQRAAALRQYQECVKALEDQLGASPQAPTSALYQAILEGHTPGPPTGIELQHLVVRELDRPDVQPAVDVAEAPAPQPTDREREPVEARRSVFVARERELAQLCGYLDAALAGQGRVVFVIGGAGRGKTDLIQEFARRAQDRWGDLVFAGGNCNAHTGFGDPYLPFREILGLLTGDVDALWHAGVITREHARRLWDAFPLVVEALVKVGPDLIDTFIPAAALVRRAAAYTAGGISDQVTWLARLEELVERKAAMPHDPSLQQSALFEQYARVMGVLARERPLLLALDDLQWADAGSVGLLFHLGRRSAGVRILIVGAYRPEELTIGRPLTSFATHPPAGAPAEPTGRWERHPLEAVLNEFQRDFGDITVDLARAEDRLFVEQYLDTEPNRLSAGFRETLYRQTRGHPLFTVELLRGMQERGDLIRDAEGRWVEGSGLDWETLPARIEAVIAERIGRLDTPSQEALRVASVEGETFSAEVVARVRSADEREMVERLSGELERRHRLVRAQEIQRLGARRLSRYRFRHILFQNYLYNHLDPVERAHLHEAVGTALEALYGEETQEIAVPLARHFQEAGIAEKAIEYLLKAGEKAKRSYANEEAITHLSRGLELLTTLPESADRDQRELDLLVALGVPLVLTKGHGAPEVERTYARARALGEQANDARQRFHALMGLRRFYLSRGEPGIAYDLGEQLLALAQSTCDPIYLSRAHMMQGEVLYCLGEFTQAREHCGQGLTFYDPQQCRSHAFLYGNDTGIGCRIIHAQALWYLGYPDQAARTADELIALAQELSHPFTLVYALHLMSIVRQLRREAQVVQQQEEAVIRISKEQGFALYLARGTALRGWALAQQCREDEGITQMQVGIAARRAVGGTTLLPHLLASLAEACGQADKTEEALSHLDEALDLVGMSGERFWEAELYRLKGALLLRREGKEAEAETCFQRAIGVARRQSARSWELRAAISLSRLWQKQGKKEEARELLQEIYGWFAEGFDTADLKEARALLDALA